MISLYRGELHKVSDVPRQWTVPKSQISLAVFKSALKKRNAALQRFLEASAAEAGASPAANGPEKPSEDHVSGSSSGEPENRGGAADDRGVDGRAENGPGSSDGNRGNGKAAGERRQERKRRREEDCREDTGRCFYAKGGSAMGQGVGRPESISRGKAKVTDDPGPEPMVLDDGNRPVAMDCDEGPSERTAMDCDKGTAGGVRVRVNDTRTSPERESKRGSTEVAVRDARLGKGKDGRNPRRNGELLQTEASGMAFSNFEENKSGQTVSATENGKGAGSTEITMTEEDVKKREELEAKLEKLRAEKHRFVLRLKQVLNEEEVKKRGSLASGSPLSLQGHLTGTHDSAGMSTTRERLGFGGFLRPADLEDGELDYARTPSPPTRNISAIHGSHISHSTLGPTPPLAPVTGRQTSLSQHLSQSSSGRGGYYVAGLGIPPSQTTPGITSGPISPRAGFMGSLPSSVGSHSYPHNMALQHTSSVHAHAQKVSSVAHGHGQFSPMPSSGGASGSSGHGVGGGPPGFSGYAMSSSVHSHHSHLSQPASSSISHLAGQGVSSSSLLTTPRGPQGYHDMRMGGSTWIQR